MEVPCAQVDATQVPTFDEGVTRELLINARVHRPYT